MTEKTSRLLLVDDEEGVRATLPIILAQSGFDVTVAGTVSEALTAINSQRFDVLLSDLNIGQPGDGFMLVSAMRRVQPDAVALIITGYPDFEVALDSIRGQVDDFLVKPVNPRTLVACIRKTIAATSGNARRHRSPVQNAAEILSANAERILATWLARVTASPELNKVALSEHERIDHLPLLVVGIVELLRVDAGEPSAQHLQAALDHGIARKQQGYSLEMVVEEARLFERCLLDVLQDNLLVVNLSRVIPDIVRITDFVQKLLKHSLTAFAVTKAP